MPEPLQEWKDPWKPPREEPEWLRTSVRACGLLSALGFLVIVIFQSWIGVWMLLAGPVLIAGIFLFVYTVVIGQIFFAWGQIRLLELILVIAMLGNALGLALSLTEGRLHEQDTWVRPALLALCAFWVLGFAAWSLWVMSCLKLESAAARLKVLALGWLIGPACYGMSLGWMHILIIPTRNTPGHLLKGAAAAMVLALGLYVVVRTYRLHSKARLAYWKALAAEVEDTSS